jgi:hypothetical protein
VRDGKEGKRHQTKQACQSVQLSSDQSHPTSRKNNGYLENIARWCESTQADSLSMVVDGTTKKFSLLIRKGDRHGLGFDFSGPAPVALWALAQTALSHPIEG